jgi:single-stranded-DNA-specific exonuclease
VSRFRRWQLTPDPPEAAALAASLGVSPLLAGLLIRRGVAEVERAAAFLDARLAEHLRSPMLFRDMARASGRLVEALQRR